MNYYDTVANMWGISNPSSKSFYDGNLSSTIKINDTVKKNNKTTLSNVLPKNSDTSKDMNSKSFIDIKDYKVIDNKIVIVTFTDNTTTKAVCNDSDNFDLERAIEICVLKKNFGTNRYYKIIKDYMKQIQEIDDAKSKKIEEENKIAHRKAKYQERKAKRMAKKRQEQIDIQAEAFLKALKAYDEIGVENNLQQFNEEMNRLSYLDKVEDFNN